MLNAGCHLSIAIEILAQSPGWEMNFHVPGDQHCLSWLNRQPILAYILGSGRLPSRNEVPHLRRQASFQ